MQINFDHKLRMGDFTTCVYQLIYNKRYKNDTQITKQFIIHGLGLCIKVDSYVDHFFMNGHSVMIHKLQ